MNVADRCARSLPWSALPDLDDGDDDAYDAAVGGSATPLHVCLNVLFNVLLVCV